MVVVAPDPYSRTFLFPGYQNVAFFAWRRGMGIPRAQEAMCVSMGADECLCVGEEQSEVFVVRSAERCVCHRERRDVCLVGR